MKILTILSFVNLTVTAAGFSQPQFTTHIIASNADGATGVAAADLDGDGDMDVLSAEFFADRIQWFENDGDGNFTNKIVANGVNGVIAFKIIDLDADGDLDVISAAHDGNSIAWHENDGDENFTTHIIASDALSASWVAADDLDGDGDLDVLSASRDDDKVAWYENDGDENFTTHLITTSADFAATAVAADVDGDGDLDVLSASGNDNKIAWYENSLITTSVEENEAGIPATFSLQQNYPNPFNPSTTIEFSLPQSSFATVKIHDLLGREVATVLEGHKSAGQHTATFDASNLASGLYYYTLAAGDFKQTRKMLLLR